MNLGKIFWNLYALCYDVLLEFNPYKEMMEEIVNKLDLSNNQEYNILDAACGTGNLEFFLLKEKINLNITSVDYSPVMLNMAKKKLSKTSIDLLLTNLDEKLPFEDNSFDRIVILNALHALPNPQKTIGEFYRILKPGGKLVIVALKNDYQLPLILKNHKHQNDPEEKWLTNNIFLVLFYVFKAFGFNKISFKFIFVTIFNQIINKKIIGFKQEYLSKMLLSESLKIDYCGLIYGDQDLFFIASKPDFSIKIAETQEEMKIIFSLRSKIFIEESGLNISQDNDKYDNQSIHFLINKCETPIGVMRLIKIEERQWDFRGLYKAPIEFDFSKSLEISRFGFIKGEGGNYKLLSLLEVALRYAMNNNFEYFCGTIRLEFLELLKRVGITFCFTSEPFIYHDKWKIVAFICDISPNKQLFLKK